MRCVSNNSYQIYKFDWYNNTYWDEIQYCPEDLVCKSSGSVIFCSEPVMNIGKLSGKSSYEFFYVIVGAIGILLLLKGVVFDLYHIAPILFDMIFLGMNFLYLF